MVHGRARNKIRSENDVTINNSEIKTCITKVLQMAMYQQIGRIQKKWMDFWTHTIYQNKSKTENLNIYSDSVNNEDLPQKAQHGLISLNSTKISQKKKTQPQTILNY